MCCSTDQCIIPLIVLLAAWGAACALTGGLTRSLGCRDDAPAHCAPGRAPPPQPPEQNEIKDRPGNPVAAQDLKQAGKLRGLHTRPPLPLELTPSLRAAVSGHT